MCSAREAPRLLYMGNSLDVGGSEVLGLELFRRLHPARFHVEAVCLKAPGALAPEYERAGIRVDANMLSTRLDPLGPLRSGSPRRVWPCRPRACVRTLLAGSDGRGLPALFERLADGGS